MSSALAARLLAAEPRPRSASRSPRGTPQPELSKPEASPMKRKADDDDNEAKRVKIEPVEGKRDVDAMPHDVADMQVSDFEAPRDIAVAL